MIAVDTNIVVRFLIADDPRQAALAQQRMTEGAFVSPGVLMETEWVLRSSFRLPRQRLADLLHDLIEVASVEFEDRDQLRWAVGRYRLGADWADLLHLIAARAHGRFATFDRDLSRGAGKDAPTAIEVLQ
jgi:predicted nucleic-acid-binding protein